MLVRAKETRIIASERHRAGSVFEWMGDAAKLPHYLELADTPPEQPEADEVIVAGKRGKRVKTFKDEALP